VCGGVDPAAEAQGKGGVKAGVAEVEEAQRLNREKTVELYRAGVPLRAGLSRS
jgi:hypothetical protein